MGLVLVAVGVAVVAGADEQLAERVAGGSAGGTVGAGRDVEVELPDRSGRADRRAGDDRGDDGTDRGDTGGAAEELGCRPNRCDAWRIELGAGATVLPLGDHLVELGDDHIRGHDAVSGRHRWSLDLATVFAGGRPTTPAASSAAGSLFLHEQGRLARLDASDGTIAWRVELGSRWVDRVGRSDDVVLVTTSDRLRGGSEPLPITLVAFDAVDGEQLWERRVVRALRPPGPAPAEATAFVAGGERARPEHRRRLYAPQGVLAVVADRDVIAGLEVGTGETVWERSAVDGERVGDEVVIRAGNGRSLLVDGATGTTLTDLGDDVIQLVPLGALVVVTSGDGRSFVVGDDGGITDRRDGPPLGWSVTSTDAFVAWNDDGWALVTRYERSGAPSRSRRLPGRIGNWGGELALGAHAGSDLVRVVGVDGRTTVAVRTDGPTEPPPNPSVAPSGSRSTLIGRTIVARDAGGVSVRAPGGSVRIDEGREVIAVGPDGTVVVRGDRGLLGVRPDRLGPVTPPEDPDRS